MSVEAPVPVSCSSSSLSPLASTWEDGEIAEGTLVVAVGTNFAESKPVLIWALRNRGQSPICILHIRQPRRHIPLWSMQASEREIADSKLDKYLQICRKNQVEAEKLYVEMDSVKEGIIRLLNGKNIRKLVMGAGFHSKYYSYKAAMMSETANYVRQNAPGGCQIWFVRGKTLVHTRVTTESVMPNDVVGWSSSNDSSPFPVIHSPHPERKIKERRKIRQSSKLSSSGSPKIKSKSSLSDPTAPSRRAVASASLSITSWEDVKQVESSREPNIQAIFSEQEEEVQKDEAQGDGVHSVFERALDELQDLVVSEDGAIYFEKLVSEGYILCSDSKTLYKVNSEKENPGRFETTSPNNVASAEMLHVAVVGDEIDETTFKTLRSFNKLRSLVFLGNHGSKLQHVPRDLFLCCESLVALDLSGAQIKELPSSAENMIHLQYLDLSWTFIEHLPKRIDRLQGLQTLKLKGCSHLRTLPDETKKLTHLIHLELDVLGQLDAVPKGMGALVNLQTLSAFLVGSEEGLRITELKNLNGLSGEFCIAMLENVQSIEEAKEASLIAKEKIKKLELRWSNYHFPDPKNEDGAILQSLCPYRELEEIQIVCYRGMSLPSWLGDATFHKITNITLFRCGHVSLLPSLEKLPSLTSLELISLNSVVKMDCRGDADHVAFPVLQKLTVDEMLNVEVWAEAQEGDYPFLVELIIKDCPELLELPFLPYLPSIKQLELSGCTTLSFVSEIFLSPSLQLLIVEDCPLIGSKQGGQDWHKIQHIPTIWIDHVVVQSCEDDKLIFNEDANESDVSE